jgi:hypothetical protein
MIGHNNGGSADLGCHFGVFNVENTLEDNLAIPLRNKFGNFGPVKCEVKLLCGPCRERGRIGKSLNMPENLHVKRNHQRRAACIFGALDKARNIIGVVHGIKLKPEWLGGGLCLRPLQSS